MANIQFKDIRKSYGDVAVVHGISLDIRDGEFIVIVGPSGCGKSTLLRMVAGLEQITSGELIIGERVVNNLEPKDRDCAMVFQNYALYPHMTVFDNMAYGLKIRGVPKDEIERRVNEAAKMLELGGLLARRPRQLSGGQRQRVAMGRAIVREPSVFLFDEPLSNLDAKLRVQTRLQIQKLHRRLKTTSLYVTHDQVEAMTLAHRMIVMNAGRAEQVGTPQEVYDDPETMFVANFIGSPPMNLVHGRVSADGSHFEHDSGVLSLSQTPDDTPRLCRLVLLATAGNTLGAMTTWLIGRLIPEREKTDRALVWLRRWGAPALLLSWLPVVGDALPLAAGWLRMPAASCAVWVAVGKLLRYVVVAAGTLSLV